MFIVISNTRNVLEKKIGTKYNHYVFGHKLQKTAIKRFKTLPFSIFRQINQGSVGINLKNFLILYRKFVGLTYY